MICNIKVCSKHRRKDQYLCMCESRLLKTSSCNQNKYSSSPLFVPKSWQFSKVWAKLVPDAPGLQFLNCIYWDLLVSIYKFVKNVPLYKNISNNLVNALIQRVAVSRKICYSILSVEYFNKLFVLIISVNKLKVSQEFKQNKFIKATSNF